MPQRFASSILLAFGVGLICCRVALAQAIESPHGPARPFVPGEVLVRFRQGTSLGAASTAHARVAGRVAARFASVDNLALVSLPATVTVEEAVRRYRKDPAVLYAEPNQARCS
jgi:hypothetical protein